MIDDEAVGKALESDGASWRARVDAAMSTTVAHHAVPVHREISLPRSTPRTKPGRQARLVAAGLIAAGCGAVATLVLVGLTHQDGHRELAQSAARTSPDAMIPNTSQALERTPIAPLSALPSANAPEGSISMPWAVMKLATESTQLVIAYAAGDGYCIRPIGVSVSETPTTVTIQVFSSNKQGDCPSSVSIARSPVTLSEPLGNRTLLHADSDAEWTQTFNQAASS